MLIPRQRLQPRLTRRLVLTQPEKIGAAISLIGLLALIGASAIGLRKRERT